MTTRKLELLVRTRLRSGPLSSREMLELFDRLFAAQNPPPSIRPFNALLTAFLHPGIPYNPTIFNLFDRLSRTDGICPDYRTYQILIDGCARTKQVGLGFGFLGRFLKEGHRPGALIFSPILTGLCRENRIDEAIAMVLDKMPKTGCAPDIVSYNAVIDGLCKEGEVCKAYDLWTEMRSKGVMPNFSTYHELTNALCKKGELDKVAELFHAMKSEGHKPDAVNKMNLWGLFSYCLS